MTAAAYTRALLEALSGQDRTKKESEESQANARAEAPASKKLTPIPANLVPPLGREKELEELQAMFQNERDVLLLAGIGGIGKTTLAREFVRRYGDEFEQIGWIDCIDSSRNSLRDSLLTQLRGRFPFDGEPEQAYQQLLLELENLPGRKLLVFDNLSGLQAAVELGRILGGFHKLITSREEHGFNSVAVEKLKPDAARELFRRFYERPVEESVLQALLVEVGFHTLMIEMLAKTLRQALVSNPGVLLERLRAKDFGNAEFRRRINMQEYAGERRTMKEQLAVLFDLAQLSEPQRLLLKQMSVLPSLHYAAEFAEFEELALELVAYGWLLRSEAGIRCHQVVQDFFALCNPACFADCEGLVRVLVERLHSKNYVNPLDRAGWIPHAECVLGRLDEDEDLLADLSINLAAIHRARGDFERALVFAEKARTIQEKTLAMKHPTLAITYNNLALIHRDRGDLERALEFGEKACTIQEKTLPPEHSTLAITYNNLATIHQDRGDLERALEFAEKTRTIQKKILVEEHPTLATTYNNLALIHQDRGDLERALEFTEKTRTIREKILAAEHPDLAITYNNLATIHQDRGDLKRALEFAEKTRTIEEKILTPEHPNLATTYNNLATIHQDRGDLKRALEFGEKARIIREKILTPEHPDLATTYNNLATINLNRGDSQQAAELIRKAIAILEHNFPQGHPDLDVMRGNLKLILEAQ